MIIPVILSGGAGTRLWPLSRELYPKQLLPLVEKQTMLQSTVGRLSSVKDMAAPVVVCNESHRFMVAEQLREMGTSSASIILEPVGRNTAPAVAVAALQAMDDGEDPVLLILPADHAIRDTEALCSAVEAALPHAAADRLITFGVVPTGPETGYGYIKAGTRLEARGPRENTDKPGVEDVTGHGSRVTAFSIKAGTRLEARGSRESTDNTGAEDVTGHGSRVTAFSVAEFVEKPDFATAEEYVASGEYTWNSGMFMFRASRYLEELEKFDPEMAACCRRSFIKARRDLDFIRLDEEAFAASPGNSIDYAVMEKTGDAAVISLDAGWSDVGSWSALWEVAPHDPDGNHYHGDVLAHDVRNCFVHAESRLVAAVGLEDHVVVETADAVLVARKDRVQDVKEIVSALKDGARSEAVLHRRVFRPWGSYECIDSSERFQVKRITVNPGATLSLQMHHHRAEHWVVVRGTARVTRGDDVLTISENESTYIPLGVTHRLENPGRIPLDLIEVQSGSYLGEDDIVRFEDSYGRS